MHDVVIIGGGIIGTALARELSRVDIDICLVEASSDVATGATKANTALVHAGFDAKPGSLMARFNREGHALYEDLCRELDVPYVNNGALVVAFDSREEAVLKELLDRGKQNEISHLEIIGRDELRSLEPNISPAAITALYAPQASIVGPWELAIASMENAMENGVQLHLNAPVTQINTEDGHFILQAGDHVIKTRVVVNCAGLFADKVHALIQKPDYTIHPRKGQYFLLDKMIGDHVRHSVFQTPSDKGKGVVCSPTVHGNIIVGPDALDISDRKDKSVTYDSLLNISQTARRAFPGLDFKMTITEFAGLRAQSSTGDFIVRHVKLIPGFFEAAGIKSPGLTAAPAIARFLSEDIVRYLGNPSPKQHFKAYRKPQIHFASCTDKEKDILIQKDSAWGRVICRCETVTEAEVVDAIQRPCGARTVDGVKRRVRPGSGRCQGGFCMPKVINILARELSISPEEVKKEELGSQILMKDNPE